MKLAKIFIILTFLFTFALAVFAQGLNNKKSILPPSEEVFRLTDGLITLVIGKNINKFSDTVRIYNDDGSLWYEFSYLESHPLYYKNNSNKEFKPFGGIDYGITLKLKGVSENWYEVVVNEDTQETKYTSIRDPFLRRERWQKYIQISPYVLFNKAENPLREIPDGQIKTLEISDSDRFVVKWIEGDWLKVLRKPSQGNDLGWVRWKNGNDILIGFELNDWIVPSKTVK